MVLRRITWSCMKICYTARRRVISALLIVIITACLIKETILLNNEIGTEKIFLDSIRDYAHRVQYECSDIAFITVPSDFTEETEVYPICKDTKFWRRSLGENSNQSCLVYSFGIQHRIEVDNAFAEMGCQVYSFDPALPYDDGSVLESGVYFNKILIADIDIQSGMKGWKLKSLASVMKSLGHETSIIDILKIDLAFDERGAHEDRVMDSLLKTNLYRCVRQLKFKVHIKEEPKADMHFYAREKMLLHRLLRLHSVGLRLFKTVESIRKLTNTFEKDLTHHIVQQHAALSWELNYVNERVSEICNE